ncbi:hypothetical protein PIB30_004606 [Stylosanthes scabra]|uniref:Uncharacterized protein n=1 Tax=Stylosanthes scabra TaxID=79078 RepID=A0ABU6Z1M2_9FABA|nr:hypothetical protein [Stylosanthes scabra]
MKLGVWEFGEKLSEITRKAQPKRSRRIIWICITAWIPRARVRASLSITVLVSLEWLNSLTIFSKKCKITLLRNIEQYHKAFLITAMLILRVDSPIYLTNCNFVKDRDLRP